MQMPHSLVNSSAEGAADLDAEFENEQRSSPLDEAAERVLRRERQIQLLEESLENPAWKAEDHPELANGTYAWVRSLRDEWESRLKELEARRNAE